MLERADYAMGCDLDALIATAQWVADTLGKPAPGAPTRAGPFPPRSRRVRPPMFDLIARFVRGWGDMGVFLLMLVENLVPVIPSEVIMPAAGFEAAAGRASFAGVVAAGTVGSVLGATAWYWLGRWLGLERMAHWAERHGRWLTLHPDEIRRADGWFRRFGPLAVGIGRSLPGVRGVICIPAGIAAMPFGAFLIWCSLGSLAWCLLLTGAGYLLQSRYGLVERWLNPVTAGFLAVCALVYVWRVATFRRKRP